MIDDPHPLGEDLQVIKILFLKYDSLSFDIIIINTYIIGLNQVIFS